jgi:hypothetical protein
MNEVRTISYYKSIRSYQVKILNIKIPTEKDIVNTTVFISYSWDSQEEVVKIKEHLEKAGFNCFMDIGQIGGGNLLYNVTLI